MKRLSILLFCSVIASGLFAQSNFRMAVNEQGKLDLFPTFTRYTIDMPEFSFDPLVYVNSYTPASTLKLDRYSPHFNPEMSILSDERPMDMQILSSAYKPFFNIYTPLLRRSNPWALDYFEAYGYGLNEHLAFVASGFQETWPGGGAYNTVSANLAWNNERWTVHGGTFAGRYATPYQIHPGFMGGVNMGVDFQATDWLKIKTWGQYTLYDKEGKDNMFLHLNPGYRNMAIGGAMEFKVTDNFGIGVMVEQNYNPMRRKWETNRMIYPIFGK
ncbi:MAG: hypothetical protein LUG98_06325 [Tannerellaceae bacterium]|nr:hypothetical protein [Tannerellaceae bacterium]